MNSIDKMEKEKKIDTFYHNYISAFPLEESAIYKQRQGVKDKDVESYYVLKKKAKLEKEDFQVDFNNLEAIRKKMQGTASEKFFSEKMLCDLLELHEILYEFLEEESSVDHNMYVMF